MTKKLKKPLHIIVDSADGLGKTTVCKLLSEKLGIPIIKMADMPKYFKKNPEEASEIYNKTVIQFKDFSFIQDRGWPSSFVYSQIYKRDDKAIEYLPDIAGKLNEKIFFLTGSEPFRGDEIVDPAKWKEINSYYAECPIDVAKSAGLNVCIINRDGLTSEEVCQKILKNI